jgi:hypothetical protein
MLYRMLNHLIDEARSSATDLCQKSIVLDENLLVHEFSGNTRCISLESMSFYSPSSMICSH